MQIGDLVRMRAHSLESIYGVGVVVKEICRDRTLLQVYWSRYGLGNRVAIHSLEKLNEFKKR